MANAVGEGRAVTQAIGASIVGNGRIAWERALETSGYCEAELDPLRPAKSAEAFKDWAAKRHLVCVPGQRYVGIDPKLFNPKDCLDRSRFGFLARYYRPREATELEKDLQLAFGIRSACVHAAILSYWTAEGVVHDMGGKIEGDRDLLHVMGFGYSELVRALDGVVRKELIQGGAHAGKPLGLGSATEYGHYLVDMDILKQRMFDSRFLLETRGRPVPLAEIGAIMGVDDVDDLRHILVDAKKRYDLNIEVSEGHVMFGAPSEDGLKSLADRERDHKAQLKEAETALHGRLQTINQLLNRYSSREAQILNETEALKEEGRLLFLKTRIVSAVRQRIEGQGRP